MPPMTKEEKGNQKKIKKKKNVKENPNIENLKQE
jgi:hypothetical protein